TLLKYRPKVVFYFETLSSLPILIYTQFFKNTSIYIHYHEIVTLAELNQGRTLNKFLNKLENKNLYTKATWISQTNMHRIQIFIDQYHLNYDSEKHRILPNYPPETWIDQGVSETNVSFMKGSKVKLLHIG